MLDKLKYLAKAMLRTQNTNKYTKMLEDLDYHIKCLVETYIDTGKLKCKKLRCYVHNGFEPYFILIIPNMFKVEIYFRRPMAEVSVETLVHDLQRYKLRNIYDNDILYQKVYTFIKEITSNKKGRTVEILTKEEIDKLIVNENEANEDKNILEKAKEIVAGDRAEAYGSIDVNFGRIAKYWSAYLNTEIRDKDVAVMMCLLKIAREQNCHKEDNLVDLCGYALIADQLSTKEKREE